MIKIWGRNTSSNVQKAMWAVGELKLAHERIDIGGKFGMNKEPKYLAMNPNGLVPTLEEEDGFLLWESNSVVRYLAAKHDKDGVLQPKDLKPRGLASQWMDWQLSVVGPGNHAGVLGLDPHAGRQARHGGDQGFPGQDRRGDADHGRAIGENEIPRRRRILLRRHSGRRHVLPLPPTGARTSRDTEPRPLVRRDFIAQGVPGSRRQYSAVVMDRVPAKQVACPGLEPGPGLRNGMFSPSSGLASFSLRLHRIRNRYPTSPGRPPRCRY